jgi:predicted RNA binding protein YcfA (HicA-like mRNA interferase family)
MGFVVSRTSGSHHVFVHPTLNELVNIQEVSGEAKPYQIRQFLRLVERYNLRLESPS